MNGSTVEERVYHDANHTKVSLRAFHDAVDVSEISKRFGGGGHRKAAGFQLPKNKHVEDLFDKPKPVRRRKKTQKVATKQKDTAKQKDAKE